LRAGRAAALLGPHTEAGVGPLLHASWADLAEPPSRSSPRAPHAHARRADHPTTTSPYTRRAAPGLPLAVAPRTALAPYRDPLPKA
jgi:hypothetical protein